MPRSSLSGFIFSELDLDVCTMFRVTYLVQVSLGGAGFQACEARPFKTG